MEFIISIILLLVIGVFLYAKSPDEENPFDSYSMIKRMESFYEDQYEETKGKELNKQVKQILGE